jgi:neutral ceramidase
LLPILFAAASMACAQGLRVGAAQVAINPPPGTPMAGYYATRLSTGVHDDLHAKAIVIASGCQRVALVACDLVGIPRAVVEEAREMTQSTSAILGANVMSSATHSHTGPLIPDGGARELIRRRFRNCQTLPRRTAAQNRRKRQACRIETGAGPRHLFGSGREETVSFNRRFFMKDGTVGWNPGKLNPNFVRPAGPIDPELPVVLFESDKGDPLATYVNFAVHQNTVAALRLRPTTRTHSPPCSAGLRISSSSPTVRWSGKPWNLRWPRSPN